MTDFRREQEPHHLISFDLEEEIEHGIRVSNLAYQTAQGLGLEEEKSYELAVAGVLHDIGKLKLAGYIAGIENPLVVEELKYVRLHSTLSYEILKERNYSPFILRSVYYHHENFDGSGYPEHLAGETIPFGARILRVCDVFAALTTDRPYRKKFDKYTALEMMIDEVKNYDMLIFLTFQKIVHEEF
ncbi:HD domain-containing protein [Lactonifactor longoviformis]|uniref:HDIG domain-containing protein n=1 Tax=Lactonifactor longoviformis DSM 17459 TaxID=1122155 RepID=A0A1M4SB65_9CLOT|nr:HD domain-containing phosphohydrolase [Lactonifactor longoviformis]POP32004.1 HD domain-containing protein [Lactonifactor longoviformis]SHE29439.1 HDIG domain-containing protein [Lactonifactor longoviformis DSM 17459]